MRSSAAGSARKAVSPKARLMRANAGWQKVAALLREGFGGYDELADDGVEPS